MGRRGESYYRSRISRAAPTVSKHGADIHQFACRATDFKRKRRLGRDSFQVRFSSSLFPFY